MTYTTEELLFILISPKELKDDIVDLLMTMDKLTGFNLKVINGYSKEHSCFSITEQVEGYREFIQFEVLLKATEKSALISHLMPVCQPAKLKYWFLPTIDSGHF
ncbi:DUF3240 family protein [Colwellia polaris]|jgi:hypothetical protein|uniref:DUF3240 family protein n=1 Tax=Colwellia polaris TaxID=326537 RepID=UPI000A1725DE|nr:DUF3240 family protein [Colwellia polaris]|tara:strand:+ start:6402 stop:6713 length:312 start_codon:yes stop_codon:yes gene_type:complete